MTRWFSVKKAWLCVALVMLLAACASPTAEPPRRLILATTTSTQDSGLLDYLLPDFKEKTGIEVQVIAVGSGQAMETGKNGDADVLLVHSPAAEETFVADGFGVDRTAVMHNDYVIVGPAADPAGIKGMTDAVEAFRKIMETQSPFISRGDDSGTHAKEKSIWAKVGVTPEGKWYVSAGQGMGAVLDMAQEMNAYTLTDRGTYLARTAEGYALPILVEGDAQLFNPYHVIAVNPEKYPDINYEGAQKFIEWITSPETQAKIAAFTEPKSGLPLFFPDAVK
ncbi:MAG TPA: extracellular solute-binding protein [Anaerolineae bacterium]|nr:extracellular solute-binding protein [Anaerolineae bacterium]